MQLSGRNYAKHSEQAHSVLRATLRSTKTREAYATGTDFYLLKSVESNYSFDKGRKLEMPLLSRQVYDVWVHQA